MSEFEIERSSKLPEPSRSVDSSNETDADGGGGMSFVFHGGKGGQEKKDEQAAPPKPPPQPIGPPVELSLSSLASLDIGGEAKPGDFGSLGGPYVPPSSVSSAIARELLAAKELDDGSPAPNPSSGPGSIIDLKA